MSETLVSVRDLEVAFEQKRLLPWRPAERTLALRGVSFDIHRREVLGLVGESGSGKTTLSRALLRLVPAVGGSVRFDGEEVLALRPDAVKALRRRAQVIFQDPSTSLNPRLTAGQTVAEALAIQQVCPRHERPARVERLFAEVGLPGGSAGRYPHQLSGGQRQRVGIARALAVEPEFLIADEPVSALDMSVQAQILNLLMQQQQRRALTVLFIGHDLSVIRHVCDRVVVLYRGEVMEIAPVETLFRQPAHPYTRMLLEASPVTHPALRRPNHAGPATQAAAQDMQGCRFAPRCRLRIAACVENRPALRDIGPDHRASCIRIGSQ